jgi:8-oxo-dGTP diphosphatase
VRTLIVAAAVVERQGRFLVTRRKAGTHLAGLWEFPGGKCEPAESLESCLARELREELAVDAIIHEEMLATAYDYPDRRVELHFFRCSISTEPTPALGQDMRWVSSEELRRLELPSADASLIGLLAPPPPS